MDIRPGRQPACLPGRICEKKSVGTAVPSPRIFSVFCPTGTGYGYWGVLCPPPRFLYRQRCTEAHRNHRNCIHYMKGIQRIFHGRFRRFVIDGCQPVTAHGAHKVVSLSSPEKRHSSRGARPAAGKAMGKFFVVSARVAHEKNAVPRLGKQSPKTSPVFRILHKRHVFIKVRGHGKLEILPGHSGKRVPVHRAEQIAVKAFRVSVLPAVGIRCLLRRHLRTHIRVQDTAEGSGRRAPGALLCACLSPGQFPQFSFFIPVKLQCI